MKLIALTLVTCLMGQAGTPENAGVKAQLNAPPGVIGPATLQAANPSTPAKTSEVPPAGTTVAESTLKTLLAANIGNSTQFRRGQMTLRLRTQTCYASTATIYDMLFRWSGQSVACDYVQRSLPKSDPEPAWTGAPTLQTPTLTRLATAPGRNTAIYRLTGAVGPGSQSQLIFFKAGRESMNMNDFLLRPDQAWFVINRRLQLRTLFETILSRGGIKETLLRIDGDRVILGDEDAKAKKSTSIEFSLSQGGNAISYINWSPVTDRKEYSARGTWSWAQLPDQRWYLKSMETEYWADEMRNPKIKEIHEKNRVEHPDFFDLDWQDKPSWQMRLDVHDFTPDAKWDGDPFDPAKWQVATGTMVEDATGPTKVRYRFGQQSGDPTAEIEALVNRLKKTKR